MKSTDGYSNSYGYNHSNEVKFLVKYVLFFILSYSVTESEFFLVIRVLLHDWKRLELVIFVMGQWPVRPNRSVKDPLLSLEKGPIRW